MTIDDRTGGGSLGGRRGKGRMTNADRIRNMDNEELALLIDDSIQYFNCDKCDKKDGGDSDCGHEGECFRHIKKWLESEAIEE